MPYPSLEQYNEALQSPQLVLQDPDLRRGLVKKTGLGLPMALCGGFALTYTIDVDRNKYALRCFHKESRELERRYQAISARLKQLNSPYFLPFEFNPNGIRIHGRTYPTVKMSWAKGRTLAEFLESEHKNTVALKCLRKALTDLSTFLEQNQLAHGDIQPENVMVSGDGSAVQLIDYDGMYVDALKGSQATELGQVNFQHPQRNADQFHPRIDHFSFLSLDVALQALIASPDLWNTSRSEPSAVVFRRNDFMNPGASAVFQEVIRMSGIKVHAENLAKVAMGPFSAIPSPRDFLQGRGITSAQIVIKTKTSSIVVYQGAYTVCSALNFDQVLRQVGNRVELVGQIHSVKKGSTRNRKPYVFVNFSDWRGKAVKLAIWFDGIDAIHPNVPDDTWVNRWVSVTGMVDTPYNDRKGSTSYTHLSITISAKGQIQVLSEKEAKFRLGMADKPSNKSSRTNIKNSKILQKMGEVHTRTASLPPSRPQPPKSSNQQVFDSMKQHPSANSQKSLLQRAQQGAQQAVQRKTKQPANSSSSSNSGCLSVFVIFAAGLVLLRNLFT